MNMRGQLLASAALSPGKRSQPLNMRPSGPQSRFNALVKGNIPFIWEESNLDIFAQWTILASPYSRNHRKI